MTPPEPPPRPSRGRTRPFTRPARRTGHRGAAPPRPAPGLRHCRAAVVAGLADLAGRRGRARSLRPPPRIFTAMGVSMNCPTFERPDPGRVQERRARLRDPRRRPGSRTGAGRRARPPFDARRRDRRPGRGPPGRRRRAGASMALLPIYFHELDIEAGGPLARLDPPLPRCTAGSGRPSPRSAWRSAWASAARGRPAWPPSAG